MQISTLFDFIFQEITGYFDPPVDPPPPPPPGFGAGAGLPGRGAATTGATVGCTMMRNAGIASTATGGAASGAVVGTGWSLD